MMSTKKSDQESQINKTITRLESDPVYLEIKERAQIDTVNVKKYAREAIQTFDLDSGWISIFQHALLLKSGYPRATGASVQPYTDPITKKQRYFIPVNPETTRENILSSYRMIKQMYKEEGGNSFIRDDDPLLTEIQIHAFRMSERGLDTQQIITYLKERFGEDYESFEIAGLIKEGQKKKLG